MLDLDSTEWVKLRHAHGSASDIPALLRALPSAPIKSNDSRREPWFSLWSGLCHQNDVGTASYAALPHIVSAAASRPPIERAEHLLLASCIEAMRHRSDSPPMPSSLDAAYSRAIEDAVPLALEAIAEESDVGWLRALLGSLATFRGEPQLGSAVLDLERELDCPQCGQVFTARGYDLFP